MSEITFDEFVEAFANDLEIENNEHLTTPLKQLPKYDSMGKITTSLTIERLFNFQIAYDDLDKHETLESLYTYCQNKQNKVDR